MIIWITGLSGAGKTTLAKSLCGLNCNHLDGDILRKTINKDLGFSAEDRYECSVRVMKLALESKTDNVIVSLTQRCPEPEKVFEIYLKTSLEECIKRDSKGLYAAYYRGEIKNMSGLDIDYVPPENPSFVIVV